jgi:60 kDa SS-A/Ro ribonucleoprotein
MSLEGVIRAQPTWTGGSTDCAMPVLDALENRIPVDVFITITDNETWAGDVHVAEALRRYRREMGIEAKAVAIAMTATDYSILPSNDPLCLNVAGFDTGALSAIRELALK